MSEVLEMVNKLVAAQSETLPKSPLQVAVPFDAFDVALKASEAEIMENDGKTTTSINVKLGDSAWFPRIWSCKPLVTC